MSGSQFNSLVVIGTIVLVAALVIANALWNPKARAKRAEARRKREEMAQLRSRLSANAQRTYEKQFGKSPKRSGANSSNSDAAVAGTALYAADSDTGSRGSDCDTSGSSSSSGSGGSSGWSWGGGDSGGGWGGGGDSGGGGGDGGGGSC